MKPKIIQLQINTTVVLFLFAFFMGLITFCIIQKHEIQTRQNLIKAQLYTIVQETLRFNNLMIQKYLDK